MKSVFYHLLTIALATSSLVAGPKPTFEKKSGSPETVDRKTSVTQQTEISRRKTDSLAPGDDTDDDSAVQARNPGATASIAERNSSGDPFGLDSSQNSGQNHGMEFPFDHALSSSAGSDGYATAGNKPPSQEHKQGAIAVVATSPFKQKEALRDQCIARYEQEFAVFQQSQEAHAQAITTVLAKEKTIVRQLLRPLKPLAERITACFPQKASRSQQAAALTAEKMAANYSALDTAATELGYQYPNDPLNQPEYSEKIISLGKENHPEQGVFILGKEVRDQLKAAHENHLLTQLQTPADSELETTLFAEIKRDLNRATFILKIPPPADRPTQPPQEELLYDHAEESATQAAIRETTAAEGRTVDEKTIQENATRILQNKGLEKFKTFVGKDRAFELAIGSLMYQRGAADLEFMKYGVSRDDRNDLAPYFTLGLQSVRQLQDYSKCRFGTEPKKEQWYSLEKTSDPGTADQFQLTLFNSLKEERVHSTTQQEFTLHTADVLTYTFAKNPLFLPDIPLSLENLPVIITCEGGQLLHHLTPFEGVRPMPSDTIGLSTWESLTPDQQTKVTTYRAAESKYLAAKQNWASRLNYLAGRPNLGSLISLEKSETERQLQTLRSSVQDVAAPVAKDPSTAPFLERNHVTTDGATITPPSLSDAKKTLVLPEKVTFLGGRELQQATTEHLKEPLIALFYKRSDETALISAAKKLIFKTADQPDASLAGKSDTEISQGFLQFTESSKIADAVSMLVQNPAATITPLLLQEPLLGDALSLLPGATASFSLEKKSHPSSDKPLFILTADYRLQHTSPSEDNLGNFARTLHARFVYALKANPLWNYSEFNSPANMPVEARCIGVQIDQKVDHGF